MTDIEKSTIGVIGLGYVGLPLAVAFGHAFPTIGFDTNEYRIAELRAGNDRTREVDADEIGAAALTFSDTIGDLAGCNVYVVTVPTPIDEHKRPDLGALKSASASAASVLSAGDVVVYESTVYPGATEEICVPILESESGLTFNRDFFAGYSPERINPGDREHRLATIIKVTSGSTPEAADFVDALYARIVPAGTHRASSIRVAEAAKVIENTQRDLNIALINELALLFDALDLDTQEVLEAAGTKWNFLPFQPGLVGGHCIGVDPYYLTYKAEEVGYNPEVILAGRRINDRMGAQIAARLVRMMAERNIKVVGSKILIMGLTFKEDCPDIRNTRVVDVIDACRGHGALVDVYDPWVDTDQAREEYNIELLDAPQDGHYDAIVVAVAHQPFRDLAPGQIRAYGRVPCVIFDVKGMLPPGTADARL